MLSALPRSMPPNCAYAERWMLLVAGFALVYPTATSDLIGFALVALQLLRRGAPGARPAS